MHLAPIEDSWLLPSRQGEFPGRPVLDEARLHHRRESTFLVLATLFVAATATLPILGASRVIDVAYAISAILPDAQLPISPGLPFGVLAFPITFFAVNLVCELYGRRRASALLFAGMLVNVALIGLMWVSDGLDRADAAFGSALAFTSCYFVAHVANLMIFNGLRHRMNGRLAGLRNVGAIVLAQLGGWAVFAFVMYGYAVQVDGQDAAIADAIFALAVGSMLYIVAFALVALIPFAIVARVLKPYLRVATGEDPVPDTNVRAQDVPAPRRRLPPAMIVEDAQDELPRRMARRTLQPFSDAEMRFFTEGEEMYESDHPGDHPVARRALA